MHHLLRFTVCILESLPTPSPEQQQCLEMKVQERGAEFNATCGERDLDAVEPVCGRKSAGQISYCVICRLAFVEINMKIAVTLLMSSMENARLRHSLISVSANHQCHRKDILCPCCA